MAEVRPTGSRAVAGVAAIYGLLIVTAILFLIPFYLLVRNGLSTDLEISAPDWKLWPSSLQFGNVTALFDNRSIPFFGSSLRTSAIVALLQTSGAVLLASMAGYGLARIPYRYANVVLGVDPGDADHPGGRVVRPELHHRFRDRVAEHVPRPDRPADVPGFRSIRRIPVPPVLPRISHRARRGGAHRWAVDVGDVLADRRAQLQGDLCGRGLDHLHRAAGMRSFGRSSWPEIRSDGRCRSPCRHSSTRRARR